jgi:hypothetical protein
MEGDREILTVVCASCGRIFASAIQMEPKMFEQIRLNRMMECCPACGRASLYSKADYLFRPSDASRWGPAPVLGEQR